MGVVSTSGTDPRDGDVDITQAKGARVSNLQLLRAGSFGAFAANPPPPGRAHADWTRHPSLHPESCVVAVPAQRMSLDDFLAWENGQETRHEFWRGEVFAMVGARRVQGLVSGNVFAALKALLKGSPCRAFVEGMKVQVGDDAIFYPDVFVTCDAQDLKTEMIFRRPRLVVELLSDSTQACDRGLKFAASRRLEGLQEYLPIEPETLRVEVFRRNERGNFELVDQTGATELVLDSLALRLPMSEVFDGVEEG